MLVLPISHAEHAPHSERRSPVATSKRDSAIMSSGSGSSAALAAKSDREVAADFTSYYLQRATREFAEDLDKVRTADDFKPEALPLLIHALQQGTAMFSPADQRRVVTAEPAKRKTG